MNICQYADVNFRVLKRTSNMVTMMLVMTPIMVIITLAIAEIMELIPRPMADTTEPCVHLAIGPAAHQEEVYHCVIWFW